MTKKVRKMANGGALSDIIGAMPKFGGPIAGSGAMTPAIGGGGGSLGGAGGGFGGGSATEGLGQVNQGSQTISSALQRAQQANSTAASAAQQANAAVGGGGIGSIDSGTGGFDGGSIFSHALKTNSTQTPQSAMKKGGTVKKYAKGGRISLEHCGVSTHTPSKKNANW